MTGHGEKFGRKKDEAIAALLSQRSVEDAARVVAISTKTLLRWLQVPEFQNAPASTRVRAADCVLDRAGKAIEIEDIEARVAELERAAKASKPVNARSNR